MGVSAKVLKEIDHAFFSGLVKRAHAAGMAAAIACTPVPMVVQQHASVLDDRSPVVKQWVVDGGVCGFAWVQAKGNTAFGRWAKKNCPEWRDSIYGGLKLWVSDFNQSMEKKSAYATAYAKTLRDAGVANVYADSRMD